MPNLIEKQSSTLLIVAIVFFSIALLGGLFYVKPTWDEVTAKNADLQEKTDQRNQMNSQLVDLQKLQQELQLSTEVSRETTVAAIPQKYDQDKLIENLSAIAVENDIVMSSVSFGAPSASIPGEIATISINASLAGSQSALLGFLRDVEGNARKLVVNSITVQIGESDLGSSRVNFNVNMDAFYQGFS